MNQLGKHGVASTVAANAMDFTTLHGLLQMWRKQNLEEDLDAPGPKASDSWEPEEVCLLQ